MELSDEKPDEFGDREFIDYRLDQELSTQFVTWKQQLIQLLKRFIDDDEVLVQSDDVFCLGTSSFYHLWEQGYKTAFEDKLDLPISQLGITLSDKWSTRSKETLIGIIPRPQWKKWNEKAFKDTGEAATLIPDTIAIWDDVESVKAFAIIDAKYYIPNLRGGPKGVPSVESITKQHPYQVAYKDFVLENGFDSVVNAFVVPADSNEVELLGRVDFRG